MSGARKLQTEIDRVMKKVDEGVALFDEIWEKVYSAEQQNQKEKYEMDLKKEIKKLQRLRDQIKTWIGSSEVKDKDALIDARRLIETKMEQFKVCEKETKTKTYSKEGLARAEKLDPVEEAKQKTTAWISSCIDTLNQLVEDRDVEIERLSAGKGKKTNKHIIEEYNSYIQNHRYHINKLEGIMRLVNNDLLDVKMVDELQEDLEYYIEAYEDDEYIQSYDEEIFYESLGLDELDVVNVDRVTQAQQLARTKSSGGSSADNDNDSASRGSRKERKAKQQLASGIIPLTIGRARAASGGAVDSKEKGSTEKAGSGSSVGGGGGTPVKGKSSSTVSDAGSVSSGRSQREHSHPVSNVSSPSLASGSSLGPAPSVLKIAPPKQGASMAAILKREGEQQEKERQAALQQAQQQQLREQQARAAQAEQLRQQQLQRQQQEAQLRHQEALRQQQQTVQAQQEAAARQQEALKRQQQQLQEERARQQQQQQHVENAAKQQQLQSNQSQLPSTQQQPANQQTQLLQAAQHHAQQQHQQQSSQPKPSSLDNLLTSGLGGLSLGSQDTSSNRDSPLSSVVTPQQQHPHHHQQQHQQQQQQHLPTTPSYDLSSTYLGALNESYLHCPSGIDSERQRTYTPRNPYPTPSSYPATPSPIFDHPAIFEKLGTDCLFFIFYYAQGTYQQYLAARELKKQSWRYHKKYMTWFQRHEEPKITTDEYEQGTYVYFDYETGWCQRIKSDFRFEYSYLEDSLII